MKILQRIRAPITYSCQDNFSHLATVKNLGAHITRYIREDLDQDARDSLSVDLHALLELFLHYDRQPLPDRKLRLVKACALMDQLFEKVQHIESSSPKDRQWPSDPRKTASQDVVHVYKGSEEVEAGGKRVRGRNRPALTGESSDKASRDPVPWEIDVQFIKGVGPKRAERFRKLGVKTLEDLLYFLPWRYEDRGNLVKICRAIPNQIQTFSIQVHAVRLHRTRRKRFRIFELIAGDETGQILVKWFNQPFLKNVLKKGQRLMLSGKVKENSYDHRLEMENPQFEILPQDGLLPPEELIHTGRIVPIYHETLGLTSGVVRTLTMDLLNTWSERIPEFLPQEVRNRYGLCTLGHALRAVHFPDRTDRIESLNQGATGVHRRLIFDDFFLLQLGLAHKHRTVAEEKGGIAFATEGGIVDRFLGQLPFNLTPAQKRAIEEIKQDMARPCAMNRLVQGDVGCGKTLIAVVALLIAIENGYQGAFMAPTEILAEQHYLTIRHWFSDLGLNAVLLTSGLSKKSREKQNQQIECGEVQLAVGTHALIEEGVRFSRLGMVVIDEQHRFGVLQRKELVKKGYHPDVLIMTATPIPRTLALSVYGDMEISIIDQLPPGRSPVQTILLQESRRTTAYEIVLRELSAGYQAYVVYPLVEESEKMDLRAATQMARRLKEAVFPNWRVALLHGQMKAEEKEKVMIGFKSHEIDLLVATTVIEVGIDVSNATVLMIEHAERFGLAQLHQLRGRVGRGSGQSTCILMTGGRLTQDARHRLEVMVKCQDGFIIAEQDLAIRGPGEFFGTRQSGLPELKVANLIRDASVLELARREAFMILEGDPGLDHPEHQLLRAALRRRWKDKLELMMTR